MREDVDVHVSGGRRTEMGEKSRTRGERSGNKTRTTPNMKEWIEGGAGDSIVGTTH